tara:strand:- start:469 stop:801 length:333 start_codon:yes stop_codon:yes gene_type:complete
MKNKLKLFTASIILIFLTGCSIPRIYEVIISQGNLIDEEMMTKLEVGMTESQVKYVLGSPLITDTFTPDRWDYYTSVTQGDRKYSESKLTLYFEDKKLTNWNKEEPLDGN